MANGSFPGTLTCRPETILLRAKSLRCALRTQSTSLRAMSSPNVFLSTPRRALRHEFHVIRSSSPDLPPLQDILTQNSTHTTTRAPLRGGSKAAPIPADANTSFISARSLWRSTQLSGETSVTTPSASVVVDAQIDADASIQILEAPVDPKPKPKPRRTRKQPAKSKVNLAAEPIAPSISLEGAKLQEENQSKVDTEVLEENGGFSEVNKKPKAARGRKKTGTMSNHFAVEAKPDPPPKEKKTVVDEPLQLEPATTRRGEWTPPAKKTVINLGSDSSALKPPCSSATSIGQASRFKNLLQDYTCQEEEISVTTVPSDEDSSFLKKRKLIELVTTKEASTSAAPALEKSPTKRKAPKKKPRTITAIATAAYRVPTQPDPVPPPSSLLNYFPNDGVAAEISAAEPQTKGKGKAKPRAKKRVSKKKAPPPKPILLSPTAALAQVAKQDFVFGTSSQLARETSPTVLRDIQAAIRHSTCIEDSEFLTPINSDAIEPPDQRPKLWDAAARDAEGDLFDIDVIDLVDGSPKLPIAGRETDPFGYFKGDDILASVDAAHTVETVDVVDTDLFVNLSDILPPPGSDPPHAFDEASPFFSDSEISVSTDVPRQTSISDDSLPTLPTDHTEDHDVGEPSMAPATQSGPKRPSYERFTDSQLARVIKTYGFKPVKRRNAMLALLDQCWESKVRMGQVGIHTSATLSPTARVRKSGITAATPKKPHGRPRKNSPSAAEPQEPPPSAQPPSPPAPSLPPKKPRGRPRKDSLSPTKASTSRTKAKAPKKAIARSTSKGKKTALNAIVEIPDSASENETDPASSPLSTPERVFSQSPPPLDLSLGEDVEMSLSISPTDQEKALFAHVTQAITTAPRTTDPHNPSWHEKILLYDPIILEDLSAWLNSGQLTRVGCDEEVDPNQLKKWCESKSICCLKKISLRGKERKRF